MERCIVAGHSSGGPYAVACAALRPAHVSAAIVLAGVTDMSWRALWDGYNEMAAQLMRIGDEKAAVAWCVERLGADGSRFFAVAEPDEAFFADQRIASILAPARAKAFRQGVIGYAHDIVIQGLRIVPQPGARTVAGKDI